LRHACDVTLLQGLGLCYSNAQALRCCSMPASRFVSGSKSLGLHARILWKKCHYFRNDDPCRHKTCTCPAHGLTRLCAKFRHRGTRRL